MLERILSITFDWVQPQESGGRGWSPGDRRQNVTLSHVCRGGAELLCLGGMCAPWPVCGGQRAALERGAISLHHVGLRFPGSLPLPAEQSRQPRTVNSWFRSLLSCHQAESPSATLLRCFLRLSPVLVFSRFFLTEV